MTSVMIVDACSIMNFAAIDRMPLFQMIVRERGRWTQAVQGEIRRSSRSTRFRPLTELLDGNWLGDPIELDGDEDRTEVENNRAALGGLAAEPLRHLGEAESIRAIQSRPELSGAVFLTDDGDATYLARRRGITVKDTRWLISDAYAMGDMACPEPYDVLRAMSDSGRAVSVPAHHKEICP